MLPQKRREVEEVGSGRGGFEVRVIGGASPPRAVEEDRSADVEEGEGMKIGLRIGAAPLVESRLTEDWEEEPVHRLEAEEGSEPPKIRATSEVGPAVPYVSRSGKKKKNGVQRMTMWMGIASCGIAVAATGGVLLLKKPSHVPIPAKEEPPAAAVSPAEMEKDYFVKNAATLTSAAEAALRRFAAVSSSAEALPLIRDPDRVKPKLERAWKPWVDGAAGPREVAGGVDISLARPAVVLSGTRADFSRFNFVFVREDSVLKLDWEASRGSGDLEISDLRGGAEANGSAVRAVVRPDDFFTVDFPEDKFRSYQLLDDTGDAYIWAFTPVDSEAAEALKSQLGEGSSILKTDESVRATLKLNGPVKKGVNQYLITEVLHKGWVSP